MAVKKIEPKVTVRQVRTGSYTFGGVRYIKNEDVAVSPEVADELLDLLDDQDVPYFKEVRDKSKPAPGSAAAAKAAKAAAAAPVDGDDGEGSGEGEEGGEGGEGEDSGEGEGGVPV